MQIISETSSNGVVERGFSLDLAPDAVTGVLWSPAAGSEHPPLVLMGHGGGLHKKAPGLVARARHYVTTCGFTVAAIDAPGHGDRPRPETDRQWVAALQQARTAGETIEPIVDAFNRSLAERAVPEWRATLDALQALPGVGAEAPVGYAGMTLGTTIGMPLVATEPRIAAAVFGGAFAHEWLVEAAKRITVPVEFLLPWDDAELDRASGLALFDAFGSKDKTLRAPVGSHRQVPWSEVENSARFFARHLDTVAASPA